MSYSTNYYTVSAQTFWYGSVSHVMVVIVCIYMCRVCNVSKCVLIICSKNSTCIVINEYIQIVCIYIYLSSTSLKVYMYYDCLKHRVS